MIPIIDTKRTPLPFDASYSRRKNLQRRLTPRDASPAEGKCEELDLFGLALLVDFPSLPRRVTFWPLYESCLHGSSIQRLHNTVGKKKIDIEA
ncbi:hypothetical protein L249_4596 [Ophiocordyceps polyrhachis-furcata BCC 54312]|uniref:Uncharacterized protein n=1 Tax=Ophiocordyceps polyrhachis-furcata BCC 54312 TaxID=1330021 RepID=A0A367LCJ7_9HYPO|nr:hypothetical protein L249_4596 [Ophiocordyceps polyrhachis-furcata BCC 54312]